MPTYDYRCDACGHEFAKFQSMKDDALVTCPECGKDSLRRLIGSGAGIIFKGSGFYETDYKRSRTGSGGGGSGEKKADNPAEKPATKPDKPDKPAKSD